MLDSTFCHLPRIGSKKEHNIWSSGILNWHDFESKNNVQLSLFSQDKKNDLINLDESWQALNQKDTDFFTRHLSKDNYYRIAVNFPEDTLFLDIETTGLSIYYDKITVIGWSLNQDYGFWIQGMEENSFKNVLAKAKILVTFNGTLFDIPFLKKEFPDLQIPLTHIDLRFLGQRVGLSGGQKVIEKVIGIERASHISDMVGETAPILWFKYLKGDWSALKLLISYNHADIVGMKKILDVIIDRLVEKQKIPVAIRPKFHFYNPNDSIDFLSNLDKFSQITIQNYDYLTPPKSRIMVTFDELNLQNNLAKLRVVGIDLSGSEKRASGWCFLEGNQVNTQQFKTNKELLQATLEVQPHLIAIDSPLSLPQGRLSVSDDDPGRQTYGITRSCERLLKKRGINVYPCLIKSMQGLTERGIYLATYFRSAGIPVIEVYPGAAQDIMRIPRKQAGIDFLKEGLIDFGIRGKFQELSVSHDELDAITSALVGLFFWSGQFEALGNEEEDYLIIPSPDKNINQWCNRKVIGFSGAIGSGKTTASMSLQSNGFIYTRFSLILADILRERGLVTNRQNLQELGRDVNVNLGQRWLCKQLTKQLPEMGNIVIDGLRFPEDHSFFLEKFGTSFFHIHIDLPELIRLERYIARGGTKQEFLEASSRPTEINIPQLASLAHRVVSNTSDLEALLSEIISVVNYTKQNNESSLCLLQS
jgi:uncharacterized protein YprB with RNaseH-like and TPR domain/predicted nuclease with RNAse H fold/dephospho-CoA kinase